MNPSRSFRVSALLLVFITASRFTYAQQSFVPEWAKDAVWYQIFPERFANGDPANDPPNVEPWGNKPTTSNYFGGDLQGVIDHLDYLQRLGINAIYFNPVFESNSNHKYHTSDYMKIDHNFGDEKVFKKLLDECHKRGIRVIIDGVFNHSGTKFWAFEDIVKNEKKSPYLHWYDVHSFPVALPPAKPNYEAWWGLGDLPKLMTGNPEVHQYLFDATTYWMKMGLDGWRLDVPNEIPHEFWVEWRKVVKTANPDAYIVGEIWDDATPWLKGDQFDAVMNYRFRGACVGWIALENISTSQFDSILAAQRAAYPRDVDEVLQNLIGSHDTERFLTLSNGDTGKLKLAALMQMTYLGAPMIYYGDEIGMVGGKDPDCRRTMVWDSTKWNMGLLNWYRKLIAIRNKYPVFRHGSFKTFMTHNKNKIWGFQRADENDTALVLIHNEPVEAMMGISFQGWGSDTFIDLLSGKKIDANTCTSISLPANSGFIFVPYKGDDK